MSRVNCYQGVCVKPLVYFPGMHHGTCVKHVHWCTLGSLTRGGGKNVPGNPGACATRDLRIWQEAHGRRTWSTSRNVIAKCVSLPCLECMRFICSYCDNWVSINDGNANKYKQILRSSLNRYKGGMSIVLIYQRCAKCDLSGWLFARLRILYDDCIEFFLLCIHLINPLQCKISPCLFCITQ